MIGKCKTPSPSGFLCGNIALFTSVDGGEPICGFCKYAAIEANGAKPSDFVRRSDIVVVVHGDVEVKTTEVRRDRHIEAVITAARAVMAYEHTFGRGVESPAIRALRLALVELDISETL